MTHIFKIAGSCSLLLLLSNCSPSDSTSENTTTTMTSKHKEINTTKINTKIQKNIQKVSNSKHNPVAKKKVKIVSTPSPQIIKIGDRNVTIVLPTVPKAIVLNKNNINNEKIHFSKRMPPNYDPDHFKKKPTIKEEVKLSNNQEINSTSTVRTIASTAGEVIHGKVSTYLLGKYISSDKVAEKLKSAEFNVIATTDINENKTLTTIIFTNKDLMSLAESKDKGFMSSLRILLDKDKKTLSITNPIYLAKAYLQKDYNTTKVQHILETLRKTFPDLKNSKDNLKFQLLSKYHFMMSMPYYDDMIEVASSKNILNKITNNQNIIATQKLNNATMLTIKLSKETSKFIDKIGYENAFVLPYTIMIENNTAKILNPKYYIALMYPTLSMSKFMAISDIPDTIEEECRSILK